MRRGLLRLAEALTTSVLRRRLIDESYWMVRNTTAMWRTLLCAAVVPLVGLCTRALGQETLSVAVETKFLTIGRGEAPVLDGRLDEAERQAATLADDFHQVEPVEYSAPTGETRIRIYYDDDALYIGARMLDSQPTTTNVLRQGAQFWGDDYFSVIIAPFNDSRNGWESIYCDSGHSYHWNEAVLKLGRC